MPAASDSRKSRTALLALSDRDALAARCAGFVVFDAVWEARLRAFCWRPRASPPFFAAARRLLADALERLDDFVERLEDRADPLDLVGRLEEDFVERLDELLAAADRPRELEPELRELDEDLPELDPLRDEPDFLPPPLFPELLLRA